MKKIAQQAEEDAQRVKEVIGLDSEQTKWMQDFLTQVRAESKLAGMQLALGMLEEKDENGTVTG